MRFAADRAVAQSCKSLARSCKSGGAAAASRSGSG